MNVSKLTKSIGFLTVINVPQLGFCGGLLLINTLGRPVEFHCTAPVVENKTQRILYGKTYESFLFCDQIGRALIAKSKREPDLVIANLPKLSAMHQTLKQPLLVLKPGDVDDGSDFADSAGSFTSGDWTFHFFGDADRQLAIAKSCCQELQRVIPLDEPFERIRQAVAEAQAQAVVR